jgi:hypothetical protein
MALELFVDKLTPCLINTATNKIVPTVFSVATKYDIEGIQRKGWAFNWNDSTLEKVNIYKLMVKGDNAIQGLVATEVFRGAVYVNILESAPHNRGENKLYEGVGGHLFAIAMRLSMSLGFGGYIFFDAKNLELVKHYSETIMANKINSPVHLYRMEVQEENAEKIINKYTLEGDLHVV